MDQRPARWSVPGPFGCLLAVVVTAGFPHPALSAPTPKAGVEHTPEPGSATPSAERTLASALRIAIQDLSQSVSHRELLSLVMQLQQALEEARAADVPSTLISNVEQGAQLLLILSDLWGICTRLTSSDLTLPCDRLEPYVEQFNALTGDVTVQLDRRRPVGICLFCENVCTQASADQLMSAMKVAVIRRLMRSAEQLEATPGPPS